MPPNWVHKYVDVGTPLEVNGLKNIWETWHANRRTSIINPLVCEFVDQCYWNQMKIPTITEERMLGMNMIVNEIPIKVWLVPSPYKDLFNLTFFQSRVDHEENESSYSFMAANIQIMFTIYCSRWNLLDGIDNNAQLVTRSITFGGPWRLINLE